MAISPAAASPDWSENHHRGPAKCRNSHPAREYDAFFDDESLALAICNGDLDTFVCPRRTECLYVAMKNCEPYGVWGGMTPRERLELRARYPGMPERWTWQHAREDNSEQSPATQEGSLCPAA